MYLPSRETERLYKWAPEEYSGNMAAILLVRWITSLSKNYWAILIEPLSNTKLRVEQLCLFSPAWLLKINMLVKGFKLIFIWRTCISCSIIQMLFEMAQDDQILLRLRSIEYIKKWNTKEMLKSQNAKDDLSKLHMCPAIFLIR